MEAMSIEKPISLVEFTEPKPDSSIVAMLEDLLAQAKAGDVQGVACAVCHRDGVSTSRALSGQCNPLSLLGAMRIAESDFIEFYIQLTGED
jgi:hypothetical protein